MYNVIFIFMLVLLGLFSGIYTGFLYAERAGRQKKAAPIRIKEKRRKRKKKKEKKKDAPKEPKKKVNLLKKRVASHEYSPELLDENEDVKEFYKRKRKAQDRKYQHLFHS